MIFKKPVPTAKKTTRLHYNDDLLSARIFIRKNYQKLNLELHFEVSRIELREDTVVHYI
jgi:hypothetical protein